MRHSCASSNVLSLIIPTLKGPTATQGFQLFTHFITHPSVLACLLLLLHNQLHVTTTPNFIWTSYSYIFLL